LQNLNFKQSSWKNDSSERQRSR